MPMWLAAALIICAAGTAIAVLRLGALSDTVQELMHAELLQQSDDLLNDLAGELERHRALSGGAVEEAVVAHRSVWPAHALLIAVRTAEGKVFEHTLRGPAQAGRALAGAWSDAASAGNALLPDGEMAVAWRPVSNGALSGARLAAVYSTTRIQGAIQDAVVRSLRLQALQVGAVLTFVLIYLWLQAGALRTLARHARASFHVGGELPNFPSLRSWFLARELGELRDALDQTRTKVNAELRRNMELWQVFRSATSTGGEALVIVDAQSKVLLCNEQVEIVLYRPLSEVIGRPLLGMLADESVSTFEAEMAEFRRVGRPPLEGQAVERMALRGDGQPFPVQTRMRTVQFRGAPCLCVSMRELSEEKRRERRLSAALVEARQAHTLKGRFLANMSHEIRTPLNGIMGMASVLERTSLDAEQQDLLQTLTSSTQRLRVLLDDILDLSKIEAGQLRMEQRPFDVRRELRRAVRSFEGAALAKGLKVRFEFLGGPTSVIGDSHRVTQILNNLLDNAIKFTERGGITVELHTVQETADEERCRIDVAVHDTGPGVAPELQSMLFAAFTQADETTTRRFGGTGLGLALSRDLCQAMQGDITVRSTPGEGATFAFHVRADLARASFDLTQPQPLPELADDGRFAGSRVLVVDDNPVNFKLVDILLRQAGARVQSARDGAEAVERVTCEDYDLVLMDVSMPRVSGYEATRAIRALPAPRAQVPIVGVTALAMQGDRERCLAAGMDAYVSKPILRDQLFQAMRHALRHAPHATVSASSPD